MASDSGIWREAMDERRPDYILAIRAQALDRVQDLIEPYENDDVPPPDVWRKIVEAAFPPPPMAPVFVLPEPDDVDTSEWSPFDADGNLNLERWTQVGAIRQDEPNTADSLHAIIAAIADAHCYNDYAASDEEFCSCGQIPAGYPANGFGWSRHFADVLTRELQHYSEAQLLNGTVLGAMRDFENAARRPDHFTND